MSDSEMIVAALGRIESKLDDHVTWEHEEHQKIRDRIAEAEGVTRMVQRLGFGLWALTVAGFGAGLNFLLSYFKHP